MSSSQSANIAFVAQSEEMIYYVRMYFHFLLGRGRLSFITHLLLYKLYKFTLIILSKELKLGQGEGVRE